jgi:DNA-binding transcriptional MocR family regulator
MSIWPPPPEKLTRPVYRAIAQSLVDAIAAGEVRDGHRLPPHRTLAFRLGVSVHTVSRAYEELTRLGVIRGEVGRGSFVIARDAGSATPWYAVKDDESVIDLSMLVPVLEPHHAAAMQEALTAIAGDLPFTAYGSFRPRAALRRHSETARAWLQSCGVDTARDRILPTNGCTGAMTVAMMTAALPGDLVLTEEVGHHTLPALANALGLKLAGVAMDREGLVPEALEESAARGARAVFVMPSGLGPRATSMSLPRREAIVDVSRRHDLLIIENDAWGPMVATDPRPLAALAPERTLYFTGLSKCTVPGLRIGWLVVPDRLIAAARTRHLVTSWMASPLVAEIATRWIADGTAAAMLAFQRTAFARRNAIARRVLGEFDLASHETGMHVWLDLPDPWQEVDFVAQARNERVAVASSESFRISAAPQRKGIRICLGGVDERRLEEGLESLAYLLRGNPEPALLTI